MERYLLFDSGCSKCTQLASAVQSKTEGWLSVRSLRDETIHQLLNRAKPNWRWEPTLLEIDGEQIRVFTGIAMRVRIMTELGPVRAWDLAKLVRESGGSVSGVNMSRRDFLHQTGALLAGLVLVRSPLKPPIGRSTMSNSIAVPCTEGEEYGGFLLLEEGTSTPDCVQDEKLGIPNMCGVSEPDQKPSNRKDAVYNALSSRADLAALNVFPTYTLDPVPSGLSPSGASLISHATGEIWGGWVSFETFSKDLNLSYNALGILARVDFMRPMPLWSSAAVEEGGPSVVLEKVDYLPGGEGILIRNPVGFSLNWIHNEVSYTLSVTHLPDAQPEDIASRLILVS